MATAISQFRNNIIADLPGCPIPRVDSAIIDAIRTFCEDTHCVERTLTAAGTPTDVGGFNQVEINLASAGGGGLVFDDGGGVSFDGGGGVDFGETVNDYDPIMPTRLKIDGADWKLSELEVYNDVDLTPLLIPNTKFFRFPDADTIQVYPFSTTNQQTFVLSLAVKPSQGVLTVADAFYQREKYRQAIEAYALYLLQKMPKRPWTDLQQAEINIGIYKSRQGSAKVTKFMGRSVGTVTMQGGYF